MLCCVADVYSQLSLKSMNEASTLFHLQTHVNRMEMDLPHIIRETLSGPSVESLYFLSVNESEKSTVVETPAYNSKKVPWDTISTGWIPPFYFVHRLYFPGYCRFQQRFFMFSAEELLLVLPEGETNGVSINICPINHGLNVEKVNLSVGCPQDGPMFKLHALFQCLLLCANALN